MLHQIKVPIVADVLFIFVLVIFNLFPFCVFVILNFCLKVIFDGDNETGVSCHHMTEKFDDGNIIHVVPYSLPNEYL